MWNRRDSLCLVIAATLAIGVVVTAVEEIPRKMQECDVHNLEKLCNESERCALDEITGKFWCTCLRDYAREPSTGKCIKRPTTLPPLIETTTEKLDASSHSSGSSVAVGLLVPTFLIGLGLLGFCIARRYRLLPCRRNLYGNVLVTRDDDDDDPPIA